MSEDQMVLEPASVRALSEWIGEQVTCRTAATGEGPLRGKLVGLGSDWVRLELKGGCQAVVFLRSLVSIEAARADGDVSPLPWLRMPDDCL